MPLLLMLFMSLLCVISATDNFSYLSQPFEQFVQSLV